MTYLFLWMWFVGAYMVWEDASRISKSGPDPAGYFYSEDIESFYHDHPELHRLINVATTVISSLFWPLTISVGIVRQFHLKLRRRCHGR